MGRARMQSLLYQQTQRKDVILDKFTFASSLSACSHSGQVSGLVGEDCSNPPFLSQDHGIRLSVESYNYLSNHPGRTLGSRECENLINSKSFQPPDMADHDISKAERVSSGCPLVRVKKEDGREQWPVYRSLKVRPIFQEDDRHLTSNEKGGRQLWKETLIPLDQPGRQSDFAVYASLLRQCGNVKALAEGRRVHAHIIKSGHNGDRFLGNLLVQMYGKCGALEEALNVFANMHRRNVFSWTIMIGAYSLHGQCKDALKLFYEMQLEGVIPDKVTFISILDVCASQAALAEGRQIHFCILGSVFQSDIAVQNALINMYGKCGCLDDARRIFDKMQERNLISWTAMIAAYAQNEQGQESLQLFQQMQLDGVAPNRVTFVSVLDACASLAALAEGKWFHSSVVASGFDSDIVIGTALVNMYGKCGSLEDARRVFDRMPERNEVSWTTMIAAYAQHGQGSDVLQLFQQMQLEGMMPDSVTFLSILAACSHAGLLVVGCQFFASMIRDHGIRPGISHYNCMIDLLGRAGQLDEIVDMINNMAVQPIARTWMTLLGACKVHCKVDQAKHAAERVFELDPDSAAPYVSLSNAYAAAGKWDDAAKLRQTMENKA